MFHSHNPLKHIDFETEGAVATWPAGSDEFNRDYTMESLGDEVMQVYTDGGWVTGNQGYESGSGMFGIGGEEVEEDGNRMLFFDGEHKHLETEYMIFTGPELYNDGLAEISGTDIERNGIDDNEVVVVREYEEGYRLERADSPEAMEDCVAFGYAEAFEDGFPVITVENARDAFMVLGYNEDFQDGLDERHREIMQRSREAESEVREQYIHEGNWKKPKHRDDIDEKKHYGLHRALAEAYVEEEGEHHDSWDPEREFNYFHPEDIEELSQREDRLADMAENILALKDATSEARDSTRDEAREELLPEFLEGAWYENVVRPSAELRDKASQHGENFLAVHDVHDAFHADMQGAKFDNPNLSDSRKLQSLVEASEREFENVEVYGIPWDAEIDGKEQPMEMIDDLKDNLPTYEDLMSDEELPAVRSSAIFNGTPFRPVMTLSDDPVDVEGDEVVDLSQML